MLTHGCLNLSRVFCCASVLFSSLSESLLVRTLSLSLALSLHVLLMMRVLLFTCFVLCVCVGRDLTWGRFYVQVHHRMCTSAFVELCVCACTSTCVRACMSFCKRTRVDPPQFPSIFSRVCVSVCLLPFFLYRPGSGVSCLSWLGSLAVRTNLCVETSAGLFVEFLGARRRGAARLTGAPRCRVPNWNGVDANLSRHNPNTATLEIPIHNPTHIAKLRFPEFRIQQPNSSGVRSVDKLHLAATNPIACWRCAAPRGRAPFGYLRVPQNSSNFSSPFKLFSFPSSLQVRAPPSFYTKNLLKLEQGSSLLENQKKRLNIKASQLIQKSKNTSENQLYSFIITHLPTSNVHTHWT